GRATRPRSSPNLAAGPPTQAQGQLAGLGDEVGARIELPTLDLEPHDLCVLRGLAHARGDLLAQAPALLAPDRLADGLRGLHDLGVTDQPGADSMLATVGVVTDDPVDPRALANRREHRIGRERKRVPARLPQQ